MVMKTLSRCNKIHPYRHPYVANPTKPKHLPPYPITPRTSWKKNDHRYQSHTILDTDTDGCQKRLRHHKPPIPNHPSSIQYRYSHPTTNRHLDLHPSHGGNVQSYHCTLTPHSPTQPYSNESLTYPKEKHWHVGGGWMGLNSIKIIDRPLRTPCWILQFVRSMMFIWKRIQDG